MELKPLGSAEWLVLPLTMLTTHGDKRTALNARLDYSRERAERRRLHKETAKLLDKEAKLFEQLIIETWTRLGEFYAARYKQDSGNQKGRRGLFAKRSQHVKFERIFTTPDAIYFKIKTRVKTPVGTKNALPHLVRVLDLINEDAVKEISYSVERFTSTVYDNPRRGAWIVIHRNEGISTVPNYVEFREVLTLYPEDMSGGQFVIGIGEHRIPIYASFADTPHMLVAGGTGSGKSNMVNHIISSLMLFTDPADVKLILIDLKRIEFGYYRNAPHLLRPVVTTAEESIQVLDFIKEEIERRTIKMENSDAKELGEWNRLYPGRKMPRIVAIIDEFAQLMQASGKKISRETEQKVTSIVNLGRAVGVHLIIATQRPSVDVVPNSIKINMPLIIGGRVQNRDQSRVILGVGDAAKLPKKTKGRMYVLAGPDLSLVQTPFIATPQVKWAVRIAEGKQRGLIKLDGIKAAINPTGIADYVFTEYGGKLHKGTLLTLLKPYGINREQIDAFLEQLIADKTIAIWGRLYALKKLSDGMRLVFDSMIEADEQELVPEQPAIQVEADKPLPPVVDTIAWFIKDRTAFKTNAQISAKKLYSAYSEWCATKDIAPDSKSAVGRALRTYGIKAIKQPSTIYIGIALNAELDKVNEADNAPIERETFKDNSNSSTSDIGEPNE